jgi:adenylate cyclase
MLAARIDRLPREEKELLQTLAAIGREFPFRLAQRVAGCPESQLDAALAHLQSAEFIYEQPAPGDVEYIFKHALTQEVAYHSLLIERRKLLHEQIAGALESLFAHRLDDHLEDLAHHYRRSNNTAKAIEYLRRKGEKAAARAFFEEAIEELNSVLELVKKLDAGKVRDGHELAVRTALMAPLIAVRSLSAPEGLLNAERLQELCKAAGEARYPAVMLAHLFSFHRSAASLQKAGALTDAAREVADENRGEFEIFCGNFISGLLAALKGEYSAARQHLKRALGISQHTLDLIIADPELSVGLPNCIGFLFTVCWILGYPDEARQQATHLAALLRQPLPENVYTSGVHHLLTLNCEFLRNYQGARAQAEEALNRSSQSRNPVGIVLGMLDLGNIMVAEGAVEAGIEKLSLMRSAEDAGARHPHLANWVLAGAYLRARRAGEGSVIIEQALAQVAAGGARLFEADFYRMKGELALIAGEAFNEAEAALNSAIAIARRQQAKSFELRASLSLARLLAQEGRRGEAYGMLAQIYDRFTEGFDTADLKEAKALLDELKGI